MDPTLLVGVHHVDADSAPTDARDQGAQRGGGAAAAADDLAQVIGVHVHLDGPSTAAGDHVDAYVGGIVHDPADQVLQRVGQVKLEGRQLSLIDRMILDGVFARLLAGAQRVPVLAKSAWTYARKAGA